jgi:polysaccharide pyruvyl transferase WcaK-like protein
MKIVVVPRKDFFLYPTYHKELYASYLSSLATFLLWLKANYDVELVLSSQTVINSQDDYLSSDDSAIDDLLKHLATSEHSVSANLKIVKPTSVLDAYALYSSADLVFTSRMHAGITALSANVPAIFVLPWSHTKVLDILSFLDLDPNRFFIDALNPDILTSKNFCDAAASIIQTLNVTKKTLESKINNALFTLDLPSRTLAKLLK